MCDPRTGKIRRLCGVCAIKALAAFTGVDPMKMLRDAGIAKPKPPPRGVKRRKAKS